MRVYQRVFFISAIALMALSSTSAKALDVQTDNVRIRSDRHGGMHIQTGDQNHYRVPTYRNPRSYQRSCTYPRCCHGNRRIVQENVQINEPGRTVARSRVYAQCQ